MRSTYLLSLTITVWTNTSVATVVAAGRISTILLTGVRFVVRVIRTTSIGLYCVNQLDFDFEAAFVLT